MMMVKKSRGNSRHSRLRATKCSRQKNYEAAKVLYSQAIDAKKDSAVAYSNRAACNLNLKQYYHALDDCNKALELDPNSCKAFYRRAVALGELSRYKLARDDFMRVLSLEPNNKLASDEVGKLKKILEQDGRLVLKTFHKPEEFRSTKPLQKFQLNNQYSGSREYNLKSNIV
uniref:Translocon at the outer membrane of chloroplasts 64 n=1 Tax=Aceria tosichella TaxID=561515 RepID=A0A6G1SDG8_9ACAR